MEGDLGALLEMSDPQVGWDISSYPFPGFPNEGKGRRSYEQMLDRLMRRPGGQRKRRDAHDRMLATYVSGWNEYQADVVEIIDANEDQVVVVLHEAARVRASDLMLARHMSHLWTVRDGRLVFLRVFRTKRAALQAAGAAGD